MCACASKGRHAASGSRLPHLRFMIRSVQASRSSCSRARMTRSRHPRGATRHSRLCGAVDTLSYRITAMLGDRSAPAAVRFPLRLWSGPQRSTSTFPALTQSNPSRSPSRSPDASGDLTIQDRRVAGRPPRGCQTTCHEVARSRHVCRLRQPSLAGRGPNDLAPVTSRASADGLGISGQCGAIINLTKPDT